MPCGPRTSARGAWARRVWLGGATFLLVVPSSSHAQPIGDPPDAGTGPDAGVPATSAGLAAPPVAGAPATLPASLVSAVVGVRSLLYAQNPNARDELDDIGASGEVDVLLSGQAHRFVKWQAGFIGVLGDATDTSAALLDLVAKLELAGPLNLWLGRMPVPSDRTSLSTVWAMAAFTMPGRYGTFAPFPLAGSPPEPGPRRGVHDRADGVTLWGQVAGGRFKYYLGAFGLDQPALPPLYSGRLAVSLLAPEPGFRTSSSYLGTRKVLGLGLGAQHRARGSQPAPGSTAPPDDFDELGGDFLLETGSESAGVFDLEAAFARLWGQNEVAKYQYFVLASYLVPLDVGIGRFQPLFRLQHAERGSAEAAVDLTSIDAQLGYVIDGHHARVSAGYQYSRIGGQPQNAVLFGVQLLSKGR